MAVDAQNEIEIDEQTQTQQQTNKIGNRRRKKLGKYWSYFKCKEKRKKPIVNG